MNIPKSTIKYIFISFAVLYLVYITMLGAVADNRPEPVVEVEVVEEELIDPCLMPDVYCSVEDQIRAIAEREEFQWVDYLLRLASCESSFNPNAYNGAYGARGLFQITTVYHPEVSDECSYDVECSTMWTMNMINQGRQHEWECNELI